jgi:hypothetical protein
MLAGNEIIWNDQNISSKWVQIVKADPELVSYVGLAVLPPARRSNSRPPVYWSAPGIPPRIASVGSLSIAEK